MSGTFLWPRLSQWSSEGVSVCPTSVDTTFNCVVGESGNSRPFSQCVRDAMHRQAQIGAGIVRLGSPSGPSAILRAISLLVVGPIKRMSRRAFAHVTIERQERIPTVVNTNASTAVIAIGLISRVATSAMHRAPLRVDTCFGHSVRPGSFGASLVVKATTTARQSIPQTFTDNDSGCPAFAAAQPVGTFALLRSRQWLWSAFDHRQTAKHHSRQINRS